MKKRYLCYAIIFSLLLFGTVRAQDQLALLEFSHRVGTKIPKSLMKRISLQIDGVMFEDALSTLSKEIDLELNYNRDQMPLNKKISLSVDRVYAAEALLALLDKTGTAMMITDGGHVLVVPQQKRQWSGSVAGVVLDHSTGEPLPGANIIVEGTSLGAATNLEGEFTLKGLPPGKYSLKARYIGYQAETQEIQIKPEQKSPVTFKLKSTIVKGEQVTVTAQAEGQMEAINQQISDRRIVNVVSSDRIQELPDANAAESVGRLPGVSINRSGGEATSVTIRGLSGGFNTVTIEGVRGVSLASITPNMLDGIVLTKSLTADMEGDATGGNVNFVLKDAPAGFRAQVDLKGGYSGIKNQFGMPKGNLSLSNRFMNQKLGVMAQVSAYQDDRSTDYFDASYVHSSQYIFHQPGEPRMTRFRLRNVNNIRNRYGASLVLDYRLPSGKLMFKNFFSQLNSMTTQRQTVAKPEKGFDAVSFEHSYRKSVSQNYSALLAGEHDVLWGVFDWQLSYAFGKGEHPTDWSADFTSNYGAYTGSDKDTKRSPEEILELFDWNMSKLKWDAHQVDYSKSEKRELGLAMDYEFPFYLSRALSGHIKFGGKYRQNNRESDKESWLSDPVFAGGYEEQGILLRDKVFSDRKLDLVDDLYPAYSNFLDESLNISDLLKNYGFLAYSNHEDMKKIAEFYDVSKGSALPYYMQEDIKADNSDYKNMSHYAAGYIMGEINIGNHLLFIPGIRYEYAENKFDTYYIDIRDRSYQYKYQQGTKIELHDSPSNVQWLPMFHLKYNLTNWADIRLASTKTLKRPGYLRYSPHLFIDSEEISRGNPNLKVETSQNFDAQVSVYSNVLGLFAVGGFYKEIDDFIYNVTSHIRSGDTVRALPPEVFGKYDPVEDFVGYDLTEPVNNKPTAYVRGIEFEWQTRFWYLPKPLNGLVLNTNMSFIDTDTKYPQYIETVGSPPWYGDKRDSLIYRDNRMQNQPDMVANISIGYDHGGFSGRLSYYYQGNTLHSVNRVFPIQDTYRDEINRWDLKLKQKITKNMSVFLDLNNITNDKDVLYYNLVNYIDQKQDYGWQGTLGLGYIFQ